MARVANERLPSSQPVLILGKQAGVLFSAEVLNAIFKKAHKCPPSLVVFWDDLQKLCSSRSQLDDFIDIMFKTFVRIVVCLNEGNDVGSWPQTQRR